MNSKNISEDVSSNSCDKSRIGNKTEDKNNLTSRNKQTPSNDEIDDEEFNKMLKKYYKISRDIRMSALIEEKKELEKMVKSPSKKYYEGSREDRIQALEEERELMEKLKDISKNRN